MKHLIVIALVLGFLWLDFQIVKGVWRWYHPSK
jgi:hypothetical protein